MSRRARHSSSPLYGSVRSGQGYQRRPSFSHGYSDWGRSSRQAQAPVPERDSPPQSCLSSISSRASMFINYIQSKSVVVVTKKIDSALGKVGAMEEVETKVGIL
ncbi:hypothetical protein CLCR_02176 [Cladophialophora carrionii]|uniref:Uncharacterized protein n=1 Tax=Cladophialophora carrionii TaxID=86049 RepID=A0A1C1CE87_9EURO|nr:hypothetical protein CLCR_02176 [Cladophialophora carrionii]